LGYFEGPVKVGLNVKDRNGKELHKGVAITNFQIRIGPSNLFYNPLKIYTGELISVDASEGAMIGVIFQTVVYN
jgi:hypothetical protein